MKKMTAEVAASPAPIAKRRRAESAGRARYAVAVGAAPMVAEEPVAWGQGGAQLVSATAAARKFSELISRVSYKGESFIVEKGGKPMCEITPIKARRFTGAELLSLLSRLPRPAEEFLTAVDDAVRHQSPLEPSAWDK